MTTIVTRAGKGSALSWNEVDANFTNLNTEKAELSGAAFTGDVSALGKVGIGSTVSSSQLHVSFSPPVSIPALGSSAGGFALGPTNAYGTLFGSNSSGTGYIQQQRFDGTGTTYPLTLQPNGGSVGIGIGAPVVKLHVQTGSGIWTQLALDANQANSRLYAGAITNAVGSFIFSNGTYATSNQYTSEATDRQGIQFKPSGISFFTDTGLTVGGAATLPTERMRIDSSGNVGIGTSSPAQRLHVVSATPLRMGTATDWFQFTQTTTNRWAWLSSSSVYSLAMDGSTGNVGIGTTSPGSYRLNVNGSQATNAIFESTQSGSYIQLKSSVGSAFLSTPVADAVGFHTSASATERMRIHASGGVSINNSTDPGVGNLSVTGNIVPAVGAAATPSYTFAGDLNTGMYWIAGDTLGFATGGIERARFGSAGDMGIGVAPGVRFHVRGVGLDTMRTVARFENGNVAGTDFHYLDVSVDAVGNVVQLASTGTNVGGFTFLTGATTRLAIEGGGNTRPGADNVSSIGTASFRWTQVFAATGTINTSDEREKVWRGGIEEAERDAARAIIGELGFYQWTDAVAEKGPEDARMHFGVRAQRVWDIMANHGLVDPIGSDGRPGKTPYAFLCYDEWDDFYESIPVQPDEDGNVDPEATPERRLLRAAGSRYGLRLDQMTLFLLAGIMPT